MTYLQNQNSYFSEPEEEPYILSNLFLLELMSSKHVSCSCEFTTQARSYSVFVRPDRHSRATEILLGGHEWLVSDNRLERSYLLAPASPLVFCDCCRSPVLCSAKQGNMWLSRGRVSGPPNMPLRVTDFSPDRIFFLSPRFPLLWHRSGGFCWTLRVRVCGQISARIFLGDFVYGKETTYRWKNIRHSWYSYTPRRKLQRCCLFSQSRLFRNSTPRVPAKQSRTLRRRS